MLRMWAPDDRGLGVLGGAFATWMDLRTKTDSDRIRYTLRIELVRALRMHRLQTPESDSSWPFVT